MNNFSTIESVDSENKCWIHTVDLSLVKSVDENNLIGFKKNMHTKNLFKKFFVGNEILLVTRLGNQYICYGYTIVEELIKNNDNLYSFYENRNKLRIKRIKYFLKPLIFNDIRSKLESVKATGRIADVLKVGYYKSISQNDLDFIKKQSLTTGMFPIYFEEYSNNMKDFILSTCKALFNVLKNQEDKSQIEISEFISLLNLSLNGYGIYKEFDDLKRFYSRYAHELGFKHIPSRDSKNFVVLLTQSGEKKNFKYINLK